MAARTISVEETTVNEGVDANALFQLVRTGDLSQTDTVSLYLFNGTATEVDDFGAGGVTITFLPGETSSPFISTNLVDDNFAEGLENFEVRLTGDAGNAPDLTLQDGFITIYDDDNSDPDFLYAPTLDTPFGTPLVFTTDQLLQGATDPDGDPVSFGEFLDLPDTVFDNVVDNGDGTFTYTPDFFAYDGFLLYTIMDSRGGQSEGFINLTSGNPEIPIFDLSFSSIVEGDDGSSNMIFTLTRFFSNPDAGEYQYPEQIRVQTTEEPLFDLETGEALATPGVDYEPIDLVLTFGPDGNVLQFPVTIYGDTNVEPNELFGIGLSSADGGPDGRSFLLGFLPQDASGTIIDDDADFALVVGTTETGSYGNKFNGTTDTDGNVFATFEGTEDDLILSFKGYDIDFDDEVAVLLNGVELGLLPKGTNNGLDDYSFDIPAGLQTPGQNIITFSQEIQNTYVWGVTDILLEVDTSGFRTIFAESVTVEEGASAQGFTIFRTGDLTKTDVINFAFVSDTATVGEDVTPFVVEGLFFNPGQSEIVVGVDILDDLFEEGLETFTVEITSGADNPPGLTLENGTITIYDDENSYPEYFEENAPVIDVPFGQEVIFDPRDYLQYATDPDGDTLTIQDGSLFAISNNPGFLFDNEDGTYTYRHNAYAFESSDEVVFTILDGRGGDAFGFIDFDLELPSVPLFNLEFDQIIEGDDGTRFMSFEFSGTDYVGPNGEQLFFEETFVIETKEEPLFELEPGQALATPGVDYEATSTAFTLGGIYGDTYDFLVPIYGDTEVELDELFGIRVYSAELGPNSEFSLNTGQLPQDASGIIFNDDVEGETFDFSLELDVTETGSYGNKFDGTNDTDGEILASFEGTTDDLTLSFKGYDIDFDNEVAVLLNGVQLGLLPAGSNNELADYSFDISAADQIAGQNTITFSQELSNTFKWGVTDVLLEQSGPPPSSSDFVLEFDILEEGEYGNKFNGQQDADGVVTGSFFGNDSDVNITFDGYDIDFDDEVVVAVNGVSLGELQAGVNNGLEDYGVSIAKSLLNAGENILTFTQLINPTYKWGVTNILLEELEAFEFTADVPLSINTLVTGEYGNKFNGNNDADGMVTVGFRGTNTDLTLNFNGFDVDFDDEIEVLLNGASIGFLDAGVNAGLSAYSIDIPADQQIVDENIITFVQAGNVNWQWGVTDLLLVEGDTPPPSTADVDLEIGTLVTESYGQNFNGATEPDGELIVGFDGTSDDLRLMFSGYDVDFDDEIAIFVNGESRGFLDAGVNNGLAEYSIDIAAEDQLAGENTVTFVQDGNVNWTWGVTDLLLTDDFIM